MKTYFDNMLITSIPYHCKKRNEIGTHSDRKDVYTNRLGCDE